MADLIYSFPGKIPKELEAIFWWHHFRDLSGRVASQTIGSVLQLQWWNKLLRTRIRTEASISLDSKVLWVLHLNVTLFISLSNAFGKLSKNSLLLFNVILSRGTTVTPFFCWKCLGSSSSGRHAGSLLVQCDEAKVMIFFPWWMLLPSPCFPLILVEIWHFRWK